MRTNFNMHYETKGKYATDLFGEKAAETILNHNNSNPMFMYMAHLAPHTANEFDPLQAPIDEISKFSYIKDPKRRRYAAMVSRMDASVGKVVAALEKNNMLENSIVLFFCDNGAPSIGDHSNSGSNHPFKGVS